jgi:hypothetical protein
MWFHDRSAMLLEVMLSKKLMYGPTSEEQRVFSVRGGENKREH